MAIKIERYKGSELHFRAKKQKQFFLGGLVLVCILFAIGAQQDEAFLDQNLVLFILIWCLCIPLSFNGFVCESLVENSQSSTQPIQDSNIWYRLSFIASLGIPGIAALCASLLTGQWLYCLFIPIALYFSLRNHSLIKTLTQ